MSSVRVSPTRNVAGETNVVLVAGGGIKIAGSLTDDELADLHDAIGERLEQLRGEQR